MPTFHDALADSAEAYDAARALAHATMRFRHDSDPAGPDGETAEHPEDAYVVLGNVMGIIRSLTQVIEQIGAVHIRHTDSARADDGSVVNGRNDVRAVRHHVYDATRYLEHAHATLNTACNAAGRIAWHLPEPGPKAPPSVDRRPATRTDETPRPADRPTDTDGPAL